MRDLPRSFCDTLFDFDAQPSNRKAGTLFQPKGLGTVLPARGRRQGSRRMATLMMAAVAVGAGVVAVMAFARILHLGQL
jgi:hypothetical protein